MKLLSLLSLSLASSLLLASTEEKATQKGGEVSSALLQKLGSELKLQMETSGAMGALHFCSQNALTLTENVAKESKTSIKRLSTLNRNPVNKPSIEESSLMNEWENLIKNGKPLPTHKLVTTKSTIVYYKPILINNEACLKCHGKVEGELAKAIKATYPEDKATGYKMGDLRGMIAVTIQRD
jgi:cytochrome c